MKLIEFIVTIESDAAVGILGREFTATLSIDHGDDLPSASELYLIEQVKEALAESYECATLVTVETRQEHDNKRKELDQDIAWENNENE